MPHQDVRDRLAALSPAKRALFEKLLEKKNLPSAPPSTVGARPKEEQPVLSHGQKRLWFLDQLEGASATYQMGGALRLEGALKPGALERALLEIVRRHEVLRTRVVVRGGGPVPVVSAEAECPLPVVSLENVPPALRDAEVSRLATEHLRRPFDLASDALLRTTLLRVAPDVHVLLLAVHHIMSDGWSIGVFFRELAALYGAYARGEVIELAPLPIQYADYAYWQQRWLTRERLAPALEHWSLRLRGAPPVLDLPFDRPRPPVQTFRGKTLRFALDPRLEQPIAALARETGTTLFMVLLAAFGMVLSRYARQEDLVVGSPVANRPKKELESLIGFFVNTLPLRIDLAGSPTVRELLARVRAMCLDAYTHQEVPFELLVEELRPERNLSHSPLFQVMFALQNAQVDAGELADLKLSTFDPDTGTSMFDFTLFVQETKSGLVAAVEYNTDLFDEATVVRFSGHFQRVLAEITSHPDRRISEITLLDATERARCLGEWNGAATRDDGPATVLAMFERAAAKYGEKAAARFAGESLTYARLHERAARLAAYLRTRGVRSGDRVVIFLDRSLEMLVALLGTLASGAVYVPLDPAFPRDRLAFMLEDSGAQMVVTETRLLESLPPCSAKCVVVDRDRDDIAHTIADGGCAPCAEDEAYVLYTSGSTGRPKGVAIAHGALAHFLTAMQREPGLDEDDVFLSVTTISFDIAALELYLPLSVGATVEIASRDVASDGLRLSSALRDARITVMQATPATWWSLLEANLSHGDLRKILCGGEALPRELARRLGKLGAELWNLYGPTETTIWSAVYRVPPEFGDAPGPEVCPIGRPIANTQIYLLDPYGHPVSTGVTGELYIGGAGVAVRYLNRPRLTSERFVPDPFGARPGGRLYRTGDLGRHRADGTIEFLGRADHQIKLRGYRIEMGEIEATLNRHPRVQASTVVCRQGGPEDKELVAYFIANSAVENSSGEQLTLGEQRVSEWRKIWDDTYREERSSAAELDIAGWNSSYTGRAVSASEMQRWVEQTTSRILRFSPRRVLDVGCGTGLILLPLLQHVESYVGTDASSVVLERLASRVPPGDASRVRFACMTAADLSKVGERDFDVIVLNSVVQYFPSFDYLSEVLAQAIKLLAPGGVVFLGDVRSLSHVRLQHAAVQFFRANSGDTRAQIRDAVERSLAREQELAIHPRAFAVLADRLGFASVETQLKGGRDNNEMTQFRYDVVLRTASPSGNANESRADCADAGAPYVDAMAFPGDALDELRARLTQTLAPEVLIVGDLPNRRVADATRVARWLDGEGDEPTAAGLRRALAGEASRGVDPDDVGALGESLGYAVEMTWAGSDPRSRFDVLFRRAALGKSAARIPPGWPRFASDDGTPLASDPLAARRERALVESLRQHLEAHLPAYMVPAKWVHLDAFPLTPNGKIDRRALPSPEEPLRSQIFVAPRSDDEKRLAVIWAEALRLDKVGINADFFELGGHSLLATQIVSRIRDTLQIELPLRSLFEARTIEGLARELRQREPHRRGVLPRIEPARTSGPAPLSFSQQRLWFLDRLEGPSPTYNLFGSMRLRGELEVPLLERALRAISERHAILRTRFVEVEGKASQVVCDEALGPLEIERVEGEEVAGDSLALREERARALATCFAHRAFDLTKGQLFRAALIELDPGDRVLVLAVHHIVADEWSIRILLREISQLYGAFARGKPSPLAALPMQYTDYAAWQREWLAGPIRRDQLAYWQKHLAGAPRSIALRTDRPRPPTQSFRGRTRTFEVSREVSTQLRELGTGARGATLFQTLLSAFTVLLSRYTEERDIVVGTPIANRTRVELEPLIGFFVNTLVLRIDLSDDPTVDELVKRVRDVCLDAQEHGDVPFESVVEELKVPRDLSRTPLFQVMFVLQNAPLSELALGDIEVSDFHVDSAIARFDLTLALEDAQGALRGAFEYNTDLFEDPTIARLTEHWLLLLEAMVTHRDARVSQLRILSDGERRRTLELSTEPYIAPEDTLTVPELLSMQARRAPNANAVISAQGSLSYAELAHRVEELAIRLAKCGVARDVVVGLYLDDPVEQLVGLLAILEAGGAYLPLDTRYPAFRISFMLADSGAPAVLTTEALAAQLGGSKCQVIFTQGNTLGSGAPMDARAVTDRKQLAPRAKPNPDDLAYVVYTSGSTGQPKGIGVSHRAIVRLSRAQCELYGIGAESRIAQCVSVSFDVAASDIVMALASGAALFLPSDEARAPGPRLVEDLAAQRITHLQLPASILANVPWRDLPDLRAVIVGGESPSRTLIERWRRGRRLFNAYGPTEATVAATAGDLLTDDSAVHIGRPLAGARVYILDRHLEPVPLGVAGEIYLGGDQLARGYVRRPALTAERFLPDPHAAHPGSRMYRTGDLARILPDGRFEFLGRTDHQVKVHGNRIELGEIESALSTHPGVEKCAVVLSERRPGQLRLAAYVVLVAGAVVSADDLRKFMQERLPLPLVPSAFAILSTLPLTQNGKVDRQALSAIEAPDARSHVAPRSPVEATLAGIWKDLLGSPEVGVFDNFFALGGDSIVSIQVVSRARQAGLDLTVKQLFQHQTVAELAAVARPSQALSAPAEVVAGPVTLTPIQRWFFDGVTRNPHHFNQSMFLVAGTKLDPVTLDDVIAHLARHHDMLRARFHAEGPSWRQTIIEGSNSIALTVEDVDASTSIEGRRAAIEASAARWQASLDLSGGPLGRAILYRGPEGEADRLLLVLHHLIVDGVSWRVLLEDLERAYKQRASGERLELQPKTTSFRAWSERLQGQALSEEAVAELPYWLDVSATDGALPLDFKVDPAELLTGAAATFTKTLDPTTTRQLLVETPAAYRTQINDVLLSALARTLASVFGVRRLRVDLEGHGREELFADVDVSRTVGWLTTFFPVVLEAVPGESVARSLCTTKETLRHVPRHGIQYGLLRYPGEGSPKSVLASFPAAHLSFNYLGRFDAAGSASLFAGEAHESPGSLSGPDEKRRYVLEVNAWTANGKLHIALTYSPAAHQTSTIERLAENLAMELGAIALHCASDDVAGYTHSDFPLAKLSDSALEGLAERYGRDVEDAYPLSPVQQGMLFHNLYAPTSDAYRQQLVARLSGDVRPEMLARAFATVIERHPALRTAFLNGTDGPLQVVLARVALPWNEQDLRHLPSSDQRSILEAFLTHDRGRGFDWERAPLLRLTLVRTDEGFTVVFTHHHLLLDGWSLSIVLGEVRGAYEAFLRDEPFQLPRPRPFRDYIAWLARRDGSSEAYWRATMAGFHAPTRLGIEKAQTLDALSLPFGERARSLSPSLTEKLKNLARETRVTLGVVVQAAWAILLARYSGERDIVFGATVAGRPSAISEVESMVGLFIVTIPVRESPTANLPLSEYLLGVQARQLAREPHLHTPLVDIKACSDVPPEASFFDTLVVFENYPAGALFDAEPGRMTVGGVRAVERTNYPLTLFVSPGHTLGLLASYDRARYDDARIATLLNHLENLLDDMAENVEAPLSRLSVLSQVERHALLEVANQTFRDESERPLTHDAIAEQAARTPEAIAVAGGGQKLTYRELMRRVHVLATRLGGLGVGREVIVGLYLERSVDLVVAILAVMRAGGTYLPLDTDFPRDRIAFMLRDSGARWVLTQTSLASAVPSSEAGIFCLDVSTGPAPFVESQDLPVTPDQTAYVIYTSGSTGRPKGVAISHASLRNFLRSMAEAPGIRCDDVLLSVTTISFDIAGLELFLPLTVGARVEILPSGQSRDGSQIMAALAASSATMMQATPSTWRMLLDEDWSSVRLNRALCGGEALPRELADALLERGLELWNLYGPTETTIWSTRQRVERTAPGAVSEVVCSIGRPIANTRVYVLDDDLEPVPPGIPGELFIAGMGVARGYLRRPALTAERFLPDPFALRGGARMYRTGDRVRYGESGALEFLGRVDHQIKLRGHRIELGEIEAVLVQHPRVASAAVVTRGEGTDAELVAYLVARNGASAEGPAVPANELRSWLTERLPASMSVSIYVWLSSLPLTLNGKIDRARLPRAEHAIEVKKQIPPSTPTELALAEIWSEVLGTGAIGVDEDFFHLGGHSLRATRVVAQIRAAFQVALPLAYFFEHPTVREMAAAIDHRLEHGATPANEASEGEEEVTL